MNKVRDIKSAGKTDAKLDKHSQKLADSKPAKFETTFTRKSGSVYTAPIEPNFATHECAKRCVLTAAQVSLTNVSDKRHSTLFVLFKQIERNLAISTTSYGKITLIRETLRLARNCGIIHRDNILGAIRYGSVIGNVSFGANSSWGLLADSMKYVATQYEAHLTNFQIDYYNNSIRCFVSAYMTIADYLKVPTVKILTIQQRKVFDKKPNHLTRVLTRQPLANEL
jgi:hypothetical protein